MTEDAVEILTHITAIWEEKQHSPLLRLHAEMFLPHGKKSQSKLIKKEQHDDVWMWMIV